MAEKKINPHDRSPRQFFKMLRRYNDFSAQLRSFIQEARDVTKMEHVLHKNNVTFKITTVWESDVSAIVDDTSISDKNHTAPPSSFIRLSVHKHEELIEAFVDRIEDFLKDYLKNLEEEGKFTYEFDDLIELIYEYIDEHI